MIFDDVLNHINSFGKYQKILYFSIVIPSMFQAPFTLIPIFILGDHHHSCELPLQDVNDTSEPYHNISVWASQCTIHQYNQTSNETTVTACSHWTYGKELDSTPISDFDLVCGSESLKTLSSMLYFMGTLVGSVVTAATGDVFGRKPVFAVSIIILAVSAMAAVFSPSYGVFVAMRFVMGVANMVVYGILFVICMEMVGPGHRVFTGIVVNLVWCIGEVLLCGLAYFITDWRTLMLVIAAPHCLLITYIFFMPESPRWLVSQGKIKRAKVVLKKIAKVNGTSLPDEEIELPQTKLGLREFLQIFKSPKLTCRLIIIIFIWFVISLSYYGLTQNVGRIGGNVYVNFLASSIVEALGYSSCLVINDRFGRKWMNCVGLWLAGVACLSTIFTSLYADESLHWITITMSMIGKLGVCGAFGNIYIYTTELFPTTMRSFTLSISNLGARSGSMLSPYVAEIGVSVDSMFGRALPLIIFGCLFVSAGSLSFALPETMNKPLPESIVDLYAEDRGSDSEDRDKNNIMADGFGAKNGNLALVDDISTPLKSSVDDRG